MNKSTNLLQIEPLVHLLSALIVVTLTFPIKFYNVSVALFLVLCILVINWKDLLSYRLFTYKIPVLFSLHFLIIALGLFYSTNLNIGAKDIERSIYPLAIIPIIYLMRSKGESIPRLFKFFVISCIGVAIYGLGYSWITLNSNSFLHFIQQGYVNFLAYTGIQPLYLSVYLLLILFYLLESIRTNYDLLSAKKKLGLAGLSFLVILIIIFLRSKTSIILLPTLLFIYVVIVLKRRGWLVVFLLMFVGVLTFLLDRNNSLNLIDKYGAVSKAFDQRLYIWKGAIEGIKTSPWIGAGTGDAQELLNAGYAKIGYQEGIHNQFNAHNQYLQFMARNGFPELLCFLAILGYSFWRSTKQSNYTFLMFNILVSLVMLTESFLSVQKGIVFFYFFLLAFVYLPEKKQETFQI